MYSNNRNGSGFSNVLGKITRTGPTKITEKETFEPINPGSDMVAKLSALHNLTGATPAMPHMPLPKVMAPVGDGIKKDRYLGWLRSSR